MSKRGLLLITGPLATNGDAYRTFGHRLSHQPMPCEEKHTPRTQPALAQKAEGPREGPLGVVPEPGDQEEAVPLGCRARESGAGGRGGRVHRGAGWWGRHAQGQGQCCSGAKRGLLGLPAASRDGLRGKDGVSGQGTWLSTQVNGREGQEPAQRGLQLSFWEGDLQGQGEGQETKKGCLNLQLRGVASHADGQVGG